MALDNLRNRNGCHLRNCYCILEAAIAVIAERVVSPYNLQGAHVVDTLSLTSVSLFQFRGGLASLVRSVISNELPKTGRDAKPASSASQPPVTKQQAGYGSSIRSRMAFSRASASLICRRRSGSSASSSCARASRRLARAA